MRRQLGWNYILVLAASLFVAHCSCDSDPTDIDGSTDGASRRDGGTGPNELCGAEPGRSCCPGRTCEDGMECRGSDRCCLQSGRNGCTTPASCCPGLACQSGQCCSPRNASCTGAGDCCGNDLVCSDNVCRSPEDDLEDPDCGFLNQRCCEGRGCRSGVCGSEANCLPCGAEGQLCCDGRTACEGSLVCQPNEERTEARCTTVTDGEADGQLNQPCAVDAEGNRTECERNLECIDDRCLRPTDAGFEGAPCFPGGGCDDGLICTYTTENPDGTCEDPPEGTECDVAGGECCDVGDPDGNSCAGGLNCQFNTCSECAGPSLHCLLEPVLASQACCEGSVCRPSPVLPRCCQGEGGTCQNGLDCCGLTTCNPGTNTCQCGGENSFCITGVECCGGLTCQTFFCRPGRDECTEAFEACENTLECCGGLRCSSFREEVSEDEEVVRQVCCSGDGGSCARNADCCGNTICDIPEGSERGSCVCRDAGETCTTSDDCCGNNARCLAGFCEEQVAGCNGGSAECGDNPDSCCDGYTCIGGVVGVPSQCCLRVGEGCEEDDDCCGNQICDPNTLRCAGTALGDECEFNQECSPASCDQGEDDIYRCT